MAELEKLARELSESEERGSEADVVVVDREEQRTRSRDRTGPQHHAEVSAHRWGLLNRQGQRWVVCNLNITL